MLVPRSNPIFLFNFWRGSWNVGTTAVRHCLSLVGTCSKFARGVWRKSLTRRNVNVRDVARAEESGSGR